jgi:putative ABC transport system substrate-binding protein
MGAAMKCAMTVRGVAFATLAAMCTVGGVHAQPQASPKMGVLVGGSASSNGKAIQQLLAGLHDLGYVDGRNIRIIIRYANGEIAKLPALADELMGEKVDVLFGGGDQSITALKRATQKVPIVMVACDALAAGLVTNLARPGGNVTGVTCINSDLAAKRVELFREIFPSKKSLAVMLRPEDIRMAAELRRTEEAAKALGMSVHTIAMRGPADFGTALQDAARKADGAIVVYDSMTFANRKAFVEAAAASKVATIFNFREFVEAGGLMSYGPNLAAMYRQATGHVHRILKGADPGTLPVEQPKAFELVMNAKTARALGIVVPRSLEMRLDASVD